MELKDVIHFYLGCKIYDDADEETPKILDIRDFKWISECIEGGRMKPILRPLSDMTEEEDQEADDLYILHADKHSEDFERVTIANAAVTQYLLSKHFDLFNLIPSGQAINSSTIKGGKE